MKQYKVVKDAAYTYIYDVYVNTFGIWNKIGHCSTSSEKDDDIIKEAKKIAFPKTLYFSE